MLSQHNSESEIEAVKIETALQVIQSSNALVKTICSPLGDNQSWDDILPQLVKTQRDENDYSPHTKVTATTLLPNDGKIKLFEPAHPKYKIMVGMIFNLQKCHVQYLFPNNAFSKDWLNKSGALIPPQVSLAQLREINLQARKKGLVLDNNEVLAGISKAALVAVFSNKNDLFSRLNALAKQHLIKRALNKLVPVFIITPQDGVVVYDEQQQIRDLRLALSKDRHDPARVLVENDLDKNISQLALASENETKEDLKKNPNNRSYDHLEKIKILLTRKDIPDELNAMILANLSISDLAQYNHELANNTEYTTVHSLISQEFNRRINADLILLTSELARPLEVGTVLEIIKNEAHDFSLIERSIIHLYQLNPEGASQVFSNYLYQVNRPNHKIIYAFLKYCPKLEARQRQKAVVFIEGGDNPWEYEPDVTVNMKKWSPLVAAILLNNHFITNKIVRHYPKNIAELMAALNELEKIHTNYPNACAYSHDKIVAAKISLLLQLRHEHRNYYTLTYADKRLIENHLVSKISCLQNTNSLYTFYRQHADGLYLNQHRHPWYDSMRQRAFPRIKENILNALQNKALQIRADVDLLHIGQGTEILANTISSLKSLLEAKRGALLKQSKSLTFSLFYSSSRTNEKIKTLNNSLEKLATITNFSELRIFTESLLLCNKLTARRSFGIGASDTYLKLKKFNDACFSTHKDYFHIPAANPY